MNKFLLILLVLFSGFATAASYQGDDIYEVGRAYAGSKTTGHFYGGNMAPVDEAKSPVCLDRKPMRMTQDNKDSESGCWWIVDDKLFGYTPTRNVFQFNIYLLELNDSYYNIEYM